MTFQNSWDRHLVSYRIPCAWQSVETPVGIDSTSIWNTSEEILSYVIYGAVNRTNLVDNCLVHDLTLCCISVTTDNSSSSGYDQ